MDWSDGDYELTAKALEPVAERVVKGLELRGGMRVLDLGCGTGNASLAAARAGAEVTAVEPAWRLREVAAARAAAEGLEQQLSVLMGEAASIPAPDGTFDVAVSIFALIFAPNAESGARELLRVTRPGGRIAFTCWIPRGPIAEAGLVLRKAAAPPAPEGPAPNPAAWGDPDWVTGLFTRLGAAKVAHEETALLFESPSPEAWFEEQEQHHPIWRGMRRMLDAQTWEGVRVKTLEALRAGNEASDGTFRSMSPYLIYTVTR